MDSNRGSAPGRIISFESPRITSRLSGSLRLSELLDSRPAYTGGGSLGSARILQLPLDNRCTNWAELLILTPAGSSWRIWGVFGNRGVERGEVDSVALIQFISKRDCSHMPRTPAL